MNGMRPRLAAPEGGLSHSRTMASSLMHAELEVEVRRRRGLPVHEEIRRGAIEYGPHSKEVVVEVGNTRVGNSRVWVKRGALYKCEHFHITIFWIKLAFGIGIFREIRPTAA